MNGEDYSLPERHEPSTATNHTTMIPDALEDWHELNKLRAQLDQILTDENYVGGVAYWVARHDAVLLREAQLRAQLATQEQAIQERGLALARAEQDNAALRSRAEKAETELGLWRDGAIVRKEDRDEREQLRAALEWYEEHALLAASSLKNWAEYGPAFKQDALAEYALIEARAALGKEAT